MQFFYIFLHICFLNYVDSFLFSKTIVQGGFLTNSKPHLHTASTGLTSSIPKIELGIKAFMRSRENPFVWKAPIRSRSFKIFTFLKLLILRLLTGNAVKKSQFELSAVSSIIRKHSKESSTLKLGTIPVFYLANLEGEPYVNQESKSVMSYFMSSYDANEQLLQLIQSNPESDVRIFTTTLESAVNNFENQKHQHSRNKDNKPVFRIQPSSQQMENINTIISSSSSSSNNNLNVKQLRDISIPMFYSEGLILKKSNSELFIPHYFAYEDLMDDWRKLKENLKPAEPKIMVKDFYQVIHSNQDIKDLYSKNELNAYQIKQSSISSALMPSRKEIDLLKQFYRY